MKDLLTRALDAHGGLSRWREIEATALQKAGIDHGAQAAVSMLGAMFRLFWNSSKRVNPCKASRMIRMLTARRLARGCEQWDRPSCRSFCVA